MKPPIIAAAASLLMIVLALAGCSLEAGNTDKPVGQRLFTRVGEVMIHIYAWENRPDSIVSFQEKPKERGFSELIYVGLNAAMQPVFFRRDVDYATAEAAAQPKVIRQPPEVTGQFTMDYRRGRLIPVRDHNIEIIEANLAGVTFTIQ